MARGVVSERSLARLWLLFALSILAPYLALPLGPGAGAILALLLAAGWAAGYDLRAPLAVRLMATLSVLSAMGWLAAALLLRLRG